MTKIDIFSGFLGAGKTTLIKKLIAEAYAGEKLVLIENEFGEIGIDGGFLKEAGIEITEMNSGCICCSLVGDFGKALEEVIARFSPERILIEPSGVGKLSDVIKAVRELTLPNVLLNSFTTVVDAKKAKVYMKNFGEFFCNQVENANCIVLSHTAALSEDKLSDCISLLREHNSDANIIATPWEDIDGKTILLGMEKQTTLKSLLSEMQEEAEICPECGHHHHDEHCDCHGNEHHHHDEHCDCHEHEHHHHDEHCDCHGHEHHHHHDEHCDCHEHDHHHHADEVFTSWGVETAAHFTAEQIASVLKELENSEKYGTILRAKGIVAGEKDWIHFDYIPSEPDIRSGAGDIIGRICVIGSKINEAEISKLFGIKQQGGSF